MPKSPGLKVVGYARCSTSEQAIEGVTLDSQAAKLRGYASLHDLDLVAIETDAGVSAKTLDRPALGRALAMLDDGRAGGLVIAKLDRLSRSVADWNRLIENYFGPAAKRQLFSVADSIDTRSPGGRLVLNVLMSVAQWEREAIADRTRDGLAHLRASGRVAGVVRFGWRATADGRLIPDPAEQEAIARMRSWRAEGRSDRWIARKLASEGISPRRAKGWTHPQVARLIRDTPRPAGEEVS